MLYLYPKFSSSVITCGASPEQVPLSALSKSVPEPMREERVEAAIFIWGLPLRYSALPVRRRLIRMMLTLQKCGAVSGSLNCPGQDAFTPAADYARSVIDTAMLRGELRCRPSGEMVRACLMETEELLGLMTGVKPNKALLRKEVKRRTADFLRQYAAGTEA